MNSLLSVFGPHRERSDEGARPQYFVRLSSLENRPLHLSLQLDSRVSSTPLGRDVARHLSCSNDTVNSNV